MIERADIGKGPVKLRPKYQKMVDWCKFDFASVFTPDGAAGQRERAEQAREIDIAAGLDDEVF